MFDVRRMPLLCWLSLFFAATLPLYYYAIYFTLIFAAFSLFFIIAMLSLPLIACLPLRCLLLISPLLSLRHADFFSRYAAAYVIYIIGHAADILMFRQRKDVYYALFTC